ncbi:MAG: hypothetical protein KDA71_19580, partial [Planctomycetales bacterium]|nr:hypothetical protein [Planctomycetales bacterium]
MSDTIAHRKFTSEAEDSFELDAEFVRTVAEALRTDDKERVRDLVVDLHYADLADLLERLDQD